MSDNGFAHESESRIAALLDRFGVKWLYEPMSFALEWDEDGNVLEGFTPDFWLPDYGLFLEITTLKQSLTTSKHSKIRKLQALYPEIRVKIIHKKDYLELMGRYGKDEGE